MKTLFNALVITFIFSIIAGGYLIYAYFKFVGGLVGEAVDDPNFDPNPSFIFDNLFSSGNITSLIVLSISSLANKIIGIIIVLKNKIIGSTEKVLWVMGFILFSFITNIVFMALKDSNKLLDESHLRNA